MIEKIIVPFDGSDNSEKGLKYACWLARQVGATIIVLYVVNVPYTGDSAVLSVRSLISAGRGFWKKPRRELTRKNAYRHAIT